MGYSVSNKKIELKHNNFDICWCKATHLMNVCVDRWTFSWSEMTQTSKWQHWKRQLTPNRALIPLKCCIFLYDGGNFNFQIFFQNLVKWAHLHIRQLGRCSSLTWRCRWCRPDWPLKKLPSFTPCCHSRLASHLQSQVSPNSSNIEHEIFKFKCCDLLKTGMMIKLKVNDVSYLSGWTTYGSRRPSG